MESNKARKPSHSTVQETCLPVGATCAAQYRAGCAGEESLDRMSPSPPNPGDDSRSSFQRPGGSLQPCPRGFCRRAVSVFTQTEPIEPCPSESGDNSYMLNSATTMSLLQPQLSSSEQRGRTWFGLKEKKKIRIRTQTFWLPGTVSWVTTKIITITCFFWVLTVYQTLSQAHYTHYLIQPSLVSSEADIVILILHLLNSTNMYCASY